MVLSSDSKMNPRNRDRTNRANVCSNCGFTENPLGADNCLQCNRPLNNKDSNTKSSAIWSQVPLFLLLLVSGILGFLWRNNSVSLKEATNEAVSSDTLDRTQDTSNTYDSGLQLKNSLEEVTNVPEGVFFYGGAMGSAGIRSQNNLSEITEAQPQFKLTYEDPLFVPPDSGVGVQMVIDGTISFSESFRPLKQSEYDLARSRGFNLKQVPVAMSAIAFYVNPRLNIPGLSLKQIAQIYSGQIDNWQQVGGPDLPIVPVSQDPDAKPSTSFLLQGMTSSQRKFSDDVVVVRDTTNAVRQVSQIPGAIGYGAQPLVVDQKTIRPISLSKEGSQNYISPVTANGEVNKQAILDGSYPLIRRIFVVLKEDGEIDELAGRAYVNLLLSKEGQTLIDRAGYLPVRYQP